MRKRLIEWGVTAASVGAFMFYGEPIVNAVKVYFDLGSDSWQLNAGLAFVVLFGSYLIGKMLTRGLKD